MFQTSAQHFEAGPAFAQRLFVCRIAFGRRTDIRRWLRQPQAKPTSRFFAPAYRCNVPKPSATTSCFFIPTTAARRHKPVALCGSAHPRMQDMLARGLSSCGWRVVQGQLEMLKISQAKMCRRGCRHPCRLSMLAMWLQVTCRSGWLRRLICVTCVRACKYAEVVARFRRGSCL